MAIRGSSEATNNNSSIHEGKNVSVRRRRRGSGSCGVKRRASAASLKCLVDYSCKQANLSANSLLRLQALVEGEKPSVPRPPRRLSAIQLENDDFASFEDSVTSHDDIASSVHKSLSPPRQQPPRTSSPAVPLCPRSPVRRCSSGSIKSVNSGADLLTGDSEHSINLDKVFESQHNKANKAEQAICCISVTISDEQDKIKFSLRNPEILKTLRKALNDEQQPESSDSDDDDNEEETTPQSTTTTTNFKPLRREIKCVIPHDRFQLPQMQVFRPKPEPQSSHQRGGQSSAPRISNSLHCIDEASEYGETSLAASKASVQSSVDSFAGDSSVDDDNSILSREKRAKEASERSERLQSLRIEEEAEDEEEVESDSDKEPQPPASVQPLAQTETVEDEPSEAEEIDSQLDVFSQSEAETQNVSEAEPLTKQQVFVRGGEVGGYPRLNPYSSLDDDDDEDESDTDTERDMDTLIGLYMNDDTVRYSIAESTIAESLVEELTEIGGDDEDEESICTADVIQYADDSLTDHNNNEDSLNVIGNSSQIGDSQTEAGYGDSQSVAFYESESDHAYDGDNTEAGDESYATLGGGDMSFSPAALLGADTDEEEEESADEYEEDMEQEEEEEEIRESAEEVESVAPGHQVQESEGESEREAAESDGSRLTHATDDSSHHNAMTRGLSVYLSSHSRAGNNSGASLNNKHSNNMMKDGHDSHTATSVTHSMSTAFPSLDASNQSSVLTSGTNRSGYTNTSGYTNSSGFSAASAYTNSTASSTRSLRSHLTSRTSRSAPTDLFRQDSINSMNKSVKSELDESGHSRRSSLDLSVSRQSSRASSAPNDDSHRRRGRRYSNLLSADSQITEASKSNFFFNSDDDSTVASAVDHRRRRRPRRSVTGDMLPLQRQASGRSSRSARIRRGSTKPSKSAIIPRSNTPQGTFLRTQSRDAGSVASSRASVKSDGRPKLPPRTLSRDKSESSNMTGEQPRRRAPRRSSSMGMGTSSTGAGRGLPQRTKSRESFMGGSRIKKWDSSTANRSGHGLSLLERHLNNGGKKQPMKKQPQRRRSSLASSKGDISFISIPSLIQSLPKEV